MNWNTGGSIWPSRSTFSLWGWLSTGKTGCRSPLLEILKSHLDKVLGNQLQVTLPEQGGWTKWHPEVPFNLSHSVILWIAISSSKQRNTDKTITNKRINLTKTSEILQNISITCPIKVVVSCFKSKVRFTIFKNKVSLLILEDVNHYT